LILHATHNGAAGTYGTVMGWFVIPLTFVTLAILSFRHWQAGRRGDGRT
jgi:hypothetical protein